VDDYRTWGQVAYEGYAEHTQWLSPITGEQIPPWDDQAPLIRQSWEAAARATLERVQAVMRYGVPR